MNSLNSLNEHIKELYHDGIRTIGKHAAKIALAGIVAIAPGCDPLQDPPPVSRPVSTDTPTPQIICRDIPGGKVCDFKGEKAFLFEIQPPSVMILGGTAQIKVYISPEVIDRTSSGQAVIYYSTGGGWYVGNRRTALARVPFNREVTLPFSPDTPNCFAFYIDDLKFQRKSGGEMHPLVVSYNVGRPSQVSLEVDKTETTTYNPITIHTGVSPSYEARGTLQISKVGSTWQQSFNMIYGSIRAGSAETKWTPPAGPGTYVINFIGWGGDSCEYVGSSAVPIRITVR